MRMVGWLQLPWPFGLKCDHWTYVPPSGFIQTCMPLWFSYRCVCLLRTMIATRYSQHEQPRTPRTEIISNLESASFPTSRKAQFETTMSTLSASMGQRFSKSISSLSGSLWPAHSQLKGIVSYQKTRFRGSRSLRAGTNRQRFGRNLKTAPWNLKIWCAAIVQMLRLENLFLMSWTLCLMASWSSPLKTAPFPGRSGCAWPRDPSSTSLPMATTGGLPARTATCPWWPKLLFVMTLMARGRWASNLMGIMSQERTTNSEFSLGPLKPAKNPDPPDHMSAGPKGRGTIHHAEAGGKRKASHQGLVPVSLWYNRGRFFKSSGLRCFTPFQVERYVIRRRDTWTF